MNIGIISDVHGDYEALETALERLDNEHNVAQILCAGDLIGRGPNPNRVVELIRERNIPCVRGNHDEWNYDLKEDHKNYLKNLPLDWQAKIGGFNVYMCHGKPGNNIWGLYKAHVSETLVRMMLSSLGSDVLITGHTHVPMYISTDAGCVLNPGSLYTVDSMRSTSHSYGVFTLPDMQFNVYDVTANIVTELAI